MCSKEQPKTINCQRRNKLEATDFGVEVMNSIKAKVKEKLGDVAQIHVLMFAVNITLNRSITSRNLPEIKFSAVCSIQVSKNYGRKNLRQNFFHILIPE